MSVLRLNEAPLKFPLLDANGTLDKVWLQYVANLADSTKGYWGNAINTLVLENITVADPDKDINNVFAIQGTVLNISLAFNNLSTVDATVTIPKKYSTENGVVTLYEIDNNGLFTTILPLYVEGSKFSIPDLSTSNRVLISGTLIRRI